MKRYMANRSVPHLGLCSLHVGALPYGMFKGSYCSDGATRPSSLSGSYTRSLMANELEADGSCGLTVTAYTYTCIHIYVYIYIYMYTYMYIHMYARIYINMHPFLHTYVHTYIHTYMHVFI